MKQKSTNIMDSLFMKSFTAKVACLLFVLALTGINFTQAQRVTNSSQTDQEQSFVNERNPGTVTPIRNNNGVNIAICPTITAINMQDMGCDKALVTWTNTMNFDSILFRVTQFGTSNVRIVTIPGTPNPGRYFIQGLLPLTTYDIEASTICVGG